MAVFNVGDHVVIGKVDPVLGEIVAMRHNSETTYGADVLTEHGNVQFCYLTAIACWNYDKVKAAFAEARKERALRQAQDRSRDLMTDDTARVEAALKWLVKYDGELDRQEISPNGDDYNALLDGVERVLRDGYVPVIHVTQVGGKRWTLKRGD